MYYTDSVIEESTVQKLFAHLLPLLCLLAMAGMLCRLNLQYAGAAIGPDLGVTAAGLGFADSLFCVGYLAASLPAAWLLLRVGARIWITGIVLASAGLVIGHALVWNAASLCAVRLLLGVAEAGLLPAMVFHIIQWMPERHRGKGIAALIGAAALVPIFVGWGSDLVLLLGRWFDFSDWRFLFVVEGLPILWLGLLAPGRVPQVPAEATWLPPSERIWLVEQLHRVAPARTGTRFTDGLRSGPMWKLAATQGIIGLVGGSLGMWVPLAMQQSGYVPPIVGAAIMVVGAVIGVAAAVGSGWLLDGRQHWRRASVACFALAGLCLAAAAALPYGIGAVLMLAIVAAIVPAILALTWMLAPCVVAGAPAAAGFALLNAAATLGYFASPGLAAIRSDAGGRCVILAAACLFAAWLVRGLDGRHPAKLAASAPSPGE